MKAKYYIIKKENTGTELLEVVEANGIAAAKKMAAAKYLEIVLSASTQLIVVGKAGYEQYYK